MALQIDYKNKKSTIKKVNVITKINKMSAIAEAIGVLTVDDKRLKKVEDKAFSISNYLDDMLVYVNKNGINSLDNQINKLVDISDVDIDELV